jgi:glycosyltransferase involved in cell wall biosynthesis
MRIALVNTANTGGGAERAVTDLAGGLAAAGHDVSLFCWHVAEPSAAAAYRLVALSEPRPLPRDPLMALLQAGDDVRRRFDGFDVVHFHDVQWNRRTPTAVTAIHWLSHHVPVFWTLHNFWPITGGCAFPGSCPRFGRGCGQCPQLGDWLIGEVDHTQVWSALKTRAWAASYVVPIVPSHWAAAQTERVLGPLGKRAAVIMHGSDAETFAPRPSVARRAALGFDDRKPLILFLQNCCTDVRKNPGFITELSRLAEGRCQLLVIGREAPEFANQVRGCTRVVGVDYVHDRAALAGYYAMADVTLQPSNQETFGLTLIESLACGTPVCARDICAFPEIIRPGETGWLLPADATPEAVIDLLDAWTPDHVATMRDTCRRDALRRFSLERVIAEHVRTYSHTVKPSEGGEARPSLAVGEATQLLLAAAVDGGGREIDLAALHDTSASTAAAFRRRYVRERWRSLGLEGEPIAVFGAGKHTRWLLQATWDARGPDVICILDDAPPPPGELVGVAVRRPEAGRPPCRRILVSSDAHEPRLVQRCRELFGDAVEVLTLYEGLAPGPYP